MFKSGLILIPRSSFNNILFRSFSSPSETPNPIHPRNKYKVPFKIPKGAPSNFDPNKFNLKIKDDGKIDLTPEPKVFNFSKQLFREECSLMTTISAYSEDLPPESLPEVAFFGKSNVGKSSLINAVLRKDLAITSKTPGRTQTINFFSIANKLILADMPGYGFAKAPKEASDAWLKLSKYYLTKRKNLKRTFFLIDGRRGITKSDKELIEYLSVLTNCTIQFVITKADKLSNKELETVKAELDRESNIYSSFFPHVIPTSSITYLGLPELRAFIVSPTGLLEKMTSKKEEKLLQKLNEQYPKY